MKRTLAFFLLFSCLAWSSSLSEIRSKGVLKIGVGKNIPPFSKMVDGEFQGFEIKLAQELGKRIFGKKSGKIELVGLDSKDRIPYLQENKVDMVVRTMSITDKRKELVDFSTPYLSVDTAMLTNKNDNIRSLSDLKGKKIIVQKGTTSQARLKAAGFNLVECTTSRECYSMLKDGSGSAYCTDNTILLAYTLIDSSLELGVKQYGKSDFIGIGVQKGNKELLRLLDSQIIQLSKEGFFKKSFEEDLDPFYKGAAQKKYFLLDDLYSILDAL